MYPKKYAVPLVILLFILSALFLTNWSWAGTILALSYETTSSVVVEVHSYDGMPLSDKMHFHAYTKNTMHGYLDAPRDGTYLITITGDPGIHTVNLHYPLTNSSLERTFTFARPRTVVWKIELKNGELLSLNFNQPRGRF